MKEVYSVNELEIAEEEWPDEDTIALIQSTVSDGLSESCRRVVNLRFTEGKSYQEIADTLHPQTIKVKICWLEQFMQFMV
ncbi:MAG: hypothetical protein K2N35_03610 [Muribaculaceae bacterium]|nr:hypothetical protein [Muribaculaceae bacterium]